MKKFIYIFLLTISLSISGCSMIKSGIDKLEDQDKQSNIDEITSKANEVIPNFESKYLLKQLSDVDLAFVVLAYQGIMNFEEEIDIQLEFRDENRPFQLLQLIQYECPEIYQFTTNSTTSAVSMNWIERNKEIVSMKIDYLLTQEEYNTSLETMKQSIQAIVDQANAYGTNAMDKETFVYNYIADHCIYNENALHNSSPYGVLIDQEAACLGISRTFQWILNELGIPCMTIGGYTPNKETGHAWNVVNLDGQYYSVDLTADTIQIDKDNYKLYLYFNVTDENLRDLYELTEGIPEVPACTETAYNYYTYYNLEVSTYEEAYNLIQTNIYQVMNQGTGSFNVKITDSQAYYEIVNSITTIYNECRQNYENSYFQASYANNDDSQILHFQIN